MKIDFLVQGNYWFNPNKIYNEGVGGAEYILMFLAKALAREHEVSIYNDPHGEKIYDYVKYFNLNRFSEDSERDILVAWRVSYHGRINAKKFIFFSTDQYTDRNWAPMLPKLDKFVCISDYHRDYIRSHYPIEEDKVVTVSPGINTLDYMNQLNKIPYKMIYCSVPDRGLQQLLESWPLIKMRVPEATLTITSDYRLWGADNPLNQKYLSYANQPGIKYLGKVPRKQLIEEQLTSEILSYPSCFFENFGVTVAECMAAGTVPVTFNIGALKQTVRDTGILIDHKIQPTETHNLLTKYTIEDQENFVNNIVDLIKNRERLKDLSARARSLAFQEYNYDAVATRFLESI